MTNIVIETGRLTADPELRYTGETPLCKFRIAVDRPKKKGADKPETDFFNCTAWNHNAEFINFNEVDKFRDFGGVRLEDDILITEDGCRVLSKNIIPYHMDEVEEFINSK